jgi:uncharacterized OB-fold protein
MSTYTKPIPRPAPESLPYWQAAQEHILKVPKCDDCAHYWFPPSLSCPECLSTKVTWTEVSGRGKIFSFVVYDRVYRPAFEADVPYIVGLIELDEGPRILSNVIGITPEDVRCEMAVNVVFDDITDEVSLPKFTPI